MLTHFRIRRAHRRFLEACRNLQEQQAHLHRLDRFTRAVLDVIAPVPLLGLDQDGRDLLGALQWLEANSSCQRLSEAIVRSYHRMLYKVDPSWAGTYRKHDIKMNDNPLKPASPQKVPALMRNLDNMLEEAQQTLDLEREPDLEVVLRYAVSIHHRLGVIHPFVDGNGRVARLAMNHLMRRYGKGYVIYPSLGLSREFWDNLVEAGRGNFEPIVAFARRHLYSV